MAAKNHISLDQNAISGKIVRVRRKQVLLDHHVAELYGGTHTGIKPSWIPNKYRVLNITYTKLSPSALVVSTSLI